MRDLTDSAQEDRKTVIRKDGATGPYNATHWAGQWSGTEPPAKPPRADGSAAARIRQAPLARRSQPDKPPQDGRERRRRRNIALTAGVAAVGLLLVGVMPKLGQQEPDRPAPAHLAQSPAANTTPPSDRTDPASAQGPASRNAEAPEPAVPGSQNGEPAVTVSQELAEARRAIETLTAQLRTQAIENDRALAQERARTAALGQEAEAARRELTETAAQHRGAIEQERAGSAALASQLSTSRQEGEALAAMLRKAVVEAGQSKQTDAARTAQSLEREQREAAALADAEAARKELAATTTQQRQLLEQERARGAALANQLLAARQDSEALTTQLRRAASETAQLKQAETARSAQFLQQEQQKAAVLTEAEAARQALASATLQQRQALEQERARGAALANQVAAARKDNDALIAQLRKVAGETAQLRQEDAAKIKQALQLEQQKGAALGEAEAARQALVATSAEHRQALEQERARGAALASQLSASRQDGEALAVQLRKAQDEAEQSRRMAETTIAELRQTLQEVRDRAVAMTSEPRAVRFGVSGPAAIEPAAIEQSSKQQPELAVAEVEQPAITERQAGEEAMRLIARASALLGQGDISSARIVLERATEMGSARASFMLAETYDPRMLSAWGTYGTRGEVARARELYEKARAGGIQEAKDRVGTLPR